MKNAILEVLNDETLTTADERVEAITTALGPLTIPKDKFNDVNSKLKMVESNYSTLSTEFDEFKKSKMTDDEKREAEAKQFEIDKKLNAVEKSSLAVEKLLLKNGIEIKDDDAELKETLQSIISEDYDKSVKLANGFISLLNKTKTETANATTTQLLNNTPKPIGGVESSSTVSKLDDLNNQLTKAIENKDSVLQTQLMTEIFNEQNKQVKI